MVSPVASHTSALGTLLRDSLNFHFSRFAFLLAAFLPAVQVCDEKKMNEDPKFIKVKWNR
jgi:hypothetical protein